MATVFKVLDTSRGDVILPVATHAGEPVDGTSGTLAKIAGPGTLLLDTTNAVLYQNSNTLASPTWTALTTATGAGTYTGTFNGIVGGSTPAAATATTIVGTDATDASSSTTGALKTAGGLGVAKAAYVGTNAVVLGATDASSSTTGSLKTAGGLGVAKKAYVGTDLHVGGASYVSAASAITAHSGGGQASATALTKTFNQITVSGADTDSVKLPAAKAGDWRIVTNDDAAQDIVVFPASTEIIDGGSADAGVVIGQGERAMFVCFVDTYWWSFALGAKLTAA